MASTLGQINPLRYRGYVYDSETGLYYLQSRYYNPEWGRFINGDDRLLLEQSAGYNLFAYCNNNPVNMADPDGHHQKPVIIKKEYEEHICFIKGTKVANIPERVFDSIDEAAKDFALLFNGLSIEMGLELGTTIYSVKGGYAYKTIVIGDYRSVTPPKAPKGKTAEADIHTHGEYLIGYDNNRFSDQDISTSLYSGLIGYMICPMGVLWKYDPSDESIIQIFSDIIFPMDPNDPAAW